MPKQSHNPRLTPDQITNVFVPLFRRTVEELEQASEGDSRLLWALRRKLLKELTYQERSTPRARMKLKKMKLIEQQGICGICRDSLPEKYSELDRFEAYLGYTPENTRLVHHHCHIGDQAKKKYA